jgi:hypothetical protein
MRYPSPKKCVERLKLTFLISSCREIADFVFPGHGPILGTERKLTRSRRAGVWSGCGFPTGLVVGSRKALCETLRRVLPCLHGNWNLAGGNLTRRLSSPEKSIIRHPTQATHTASPQTPGLLVARCQRTMTAQAERSCQAVSPFGVGNPEQENGRELQTDPLVIPYSSARP